MPKTFKGDVTNNVVELNLLDGNIGTLPDLGTPTIITKNTGPNVVQQIVGDIPANEFTLDNTLKGLVIGTSCTVIGSSAFYYCGNITGNLVIPDSVTTIQGTSPFGGAFIGCTGFTGDLVIPDSVTSIGDYAFGTCTGFDGHLVIPYSVTSIGSSAFLYCTSLTAAYINRPASSWVGSNALGLTSSLTNIYVHADYVAGYDAAWKTAQGTSATVSTWTNYPNPTP